MIPTNEPIAVLMSGGVDSSVAAYLLKKEGYSVLGVTLRLIPPHLEEPASCSQILNDAKKAAEKIGIEHQVLDLRETFLASIVNPFKEAYLAGKTPNPCIQCNPKIKFGAAFEEVRKLGYQKMATGHYVQVLKEESGSWGLYKGVDSQKDQSYFLYRLPKTLLPDLVFPLGTKTKDEVKKISEELGLGLEKKPESNEVCFVSDQNYRTLLGKIPGKGEFITTGGKVLGTHSGIHNFTVGQRKGLGLSGGPWYVVELVPEKNQVVIGPLSEIEETKVFLDQINLLFSLKLGDEVEIKIRYRNEGALANILQISENQMVLETQKPVRGVSPGQSGVLYRGDQVLGGGTIQKLPG